MHFRNHTEQTENENVKIITSCCIGEIIPLERLSNDVFSSLILGDGFGVVPYENRIVSPVEGVVKDVSENEHEVTVKTTDGLILIISVGFNSSSDLLRVKCNVSPNQRVDNDTLIWDIDAAEYKKQGKAVVAAVIVTNSSILPSFNIRYGRVKYIGQPVMKITV